MKIIGNIFFAVIMVWSSTISAQNGSLRQIFRYPPESAKPWVFWYWMQAAVSTEGITADLEAMKEAGIGGAYLAPIKGAANPPLLNPPAEQLTPEWWKMVRFAMKEADRLGLKIAMHASDGFATAGGPWITPEHSMQKVAWTETYVKGGRRFNDQLSMPESYQGYYRDIAVLAFPSTEEVEYSTHTIKPRITTSLPDINAQFLADTNSKETFKSKEPCWIQYMFDQPFTCRSVIVRTSGNNYQAQRLLIEVSDDGEHFRLVSRMEPPRHGWLDYDADVTHAIDPVTARCFRFRYDKAGSEPASEDLDAAKWSPTLKIKGITLSSAPRINQFEGKNGQVWRVGKRTTAIMVPDSLCVPIDKIIDLTGKTDANGRLTWDIPAGHWTILRIGHTSTGHVNATAGAGKGLECDKFDPAAVKLQFDRWFGEIIHETGHDLASRVLKVFHVDSWECGSQNWSPVFREEFKKRRGYDLFSYLPVFAGIPVQSADVSERFLYDVRQTISELVVDNFYGTLADLAKDKGCIFTGESVAPVMTSDGMLHYKVVDAPMGEFWLNSPSHDKPNDMFDAVSGAHVYGKSIIQAEAFTTVRMAWNENPSMLKALQDRNYALGINRLVYHVFVHNPWIDRKPGMTLDGVGLYFQRDQTWWKPGKVWVDYAQRCQALLQQGVPVTDIAVFTGEEIPRRAILPDRLVSTLPGIFGAGVVQREAQRLANTGVPTRVVSEGVTITSNMAEPENWTDPLRGYAYDAINPDALLRLATVKDGRIVLPGGASYGLLALPAQHAMMPDSTMMSAEIAEKLLGLVKEGATLLISEKYDHSPGLQNRDESNQNVKNVMQELWKGCPMVTSSYSTGQPLMWKVGKGRVIRGPYTAESFAGIGMERDVYIKDSTHQQAKGIAWTHRSVQGTDIYFISNQQDRQRVFDVSLRVSGRLPELWDAVTGEMQVARQWKTEKGRTILPVKLEPNSSVFIVLQQALKKPANGGKNWVEPKPKQALEGAWKVTFDPKAGGPAQPVVFEHLADWSQHPDSGIRYYSGTATYSKTFRWKAVKGVQERVWLDLGKIADIAEVKINSISCGVAWTTPYRVEITGALKPGENTVSIDVTNTWRNRLIGDHSLPEAQRITSTTAPYRLDGKPLRQAGLLGPVQIVGN